jgi:hypothetical protein
MARASISPMRHPRLPGHSRFDGIVERDRRRLHGPTRLGAVRRHPPRRLQVGYAEHILGRALGVIDHRRVHGRRSHGRRERVCGALQSVREPDRRDRREAPHMAAIGICMDFLHRVFRSGCRAQLRRSSHAVRIRTAMAASAVMLAALSATPAAAQATDDHARWASPGRFTPEWEFLHFLEDAMDKNDSGGCSADRRTG